MQNLNQSLNETLQGKYPHLELSVLSFSQVQKDNESKRIDSEYFKKEYLEIDDILDNLNPIYLDIKNIVSGPFGSTLTSESYTTEGINFIRVVDIKGGFFIDKENIIKISEYDNQKIKNSELICGDFIISKVGNSIGYVAQLQDDIKKCNISENNIGIKMRGFDECYKKYVLTFLNSKYGQLQISRRISGNAQPKINVSDFSKIKIPRFSSDFQLEIEKLIKDSYKALEDSKILYKEAESLLYEALRLDSNNPLESSAYCSICSLSQSYGKSGRLDSEYYQSKYDAIERKIRGFSHKKLGDLVTIQKSIEPGSEAYQDEGIEFVRVANLSKFGISKSDICLSERDFGKDLEKLAPKKETILLSKDGSIGISYCLEEDLECITSGAILHLKVKDKSEILPQVLSLILNSIVVKLQAERDSGGSIISHWKISEIENVLIPLLDFKLQEQIAQKIQKSFALRKESKDLLESAKAKVENTIENEGKNA